MPLSHLPEQLRAFPSLWIHPCPGCAGSAPSADDVGGPDSQSRPCQLRVKAWFSSCGFCVMAGLIITPSVALSKLILCAPTHLFPPSWQHLRWVPATVTPMGKQNLAPQEEEIRVPMLARDPGISTALEVGTRAGCSPYLLLEAIPQLLGSRGAARGEEE